MAKATTCALIALLCSSVAEAQDAPAWVKQQNDKWYALYHAGDAAGLSRLYMEEAVVLQPDRRLQGRAAIEKFNADNFQGTTFSCTYELDGAGSLEKLAVVWGYDSCVETPKSGGSPKTAKSRWMTVYERQTDGSWLIARESVDAVTP